MSSSQWHEDQSAGARAEARWAQEKAWLDKLASAAKVAEARVAELEKENAKLEALPEKMLRFAEERFDRVLCRERGATDEGVAYEYGYRLDEIRGVVAGLRVAIGTWDDERKETP